MSIRRLNYTKRKRLTRDEARISLFRDGQNRRFFDAALNLPADLPPTARVFVEAYRSSPSLRVRFDFGTVGAMAPPSLGDRSLDEFDDQLPAPRFRVKVTDVDSSPGRLLALADGIKPTDQSDEPERRKGLLFVGWERLDGHIWTLDIQEDQGPVLIIDDGIADPLRRLANDPWFVALVYPEVLRRTLEYVLSDKLALLEDETYPWALQWMRFAAALPGMEAKTLPQSGMDKEEKRDWIDAATAAFARHHSLQKAVASEPPE